MILKAIYNLLTADGTVSGLVGTRVYNIFSTQRAAVPYVTFQRIGQVPNRNADKEIGVESVRAQINCVAATEEQSDTLAEAVKNALHGVTDTVSGGSTIQSIIFDDAEEDNDPENARSIVMLDFVIREKK